MSIDWLKSITKESLMPDLSDSYLLEELREKFEVVDLGINAVLVLNKKQGNWIRFAVMEFSHGTGDGKENYMSVIFHGSGPSEGLRECRHTWWGEGDGYVFYPNGRTISLAFKELSKYFDDMV